MTRNGRNETFRFLHLFIYFFNVVFSPLFLAINTGSEYGTAECRKQDNEDDEMTQGIRVSLRRRNGVSRSECYRRAFRALFASFAFSRPVFNGKRVRRHPGTVFTSANSTTPRNLFRKGLRSVLRNSREQRESGESADDFCPERFGIIEKFVPA